LYFVAKQKETGALQILKILCDLTEYKCYAVNQEFVPEYIKSVIICAVALQTESSVHMDTRVFYL